VTCRDWFQLSLKEGLTVFRDQEYTADVTSRPVKRVSDAAVILEDQFSEDSGAMAHPVRPEEVDTIDNFYSCTVYEKGAEVIRMYELLLGREGFRKGVKVYLERHDGTAATCDDFLQAMREISAEQRGGSPHPAFETFDRWYSQAGTPLLKIAWEHCPQTQQVIFRCTQTLPETADWQGPQPKQPQVLPIRIGLLDPLTGMGLPIDEAGATSITLVMTELEQTFTVEGVAECPLPSFLRGFSAPVKLEVEPPLSATQLALLMHHDSDEFNRWGAAQDVGHRMVCRALQRRKEGASLVDEFCSPDDEAAIEAFQAVLSSDADEMFITETMRLPGLDIFIAEEAPRANPLLIYDARHACQCAIALKLAEQMRSRVESCHVPGPYEYSHANAAKRALRNFCVRQLALAGIDEGLAAAAFSSASNMTDQLGALAALCTQPGEARDGALEAFYTQHAQDKMVVRKWLRLKSSAEVLGNLEVVKALLEHEAFDINNPTTVSAVVSRFTGSTINFHAEDGSGYAFLADMAVEVDAINRQGGASLLDSFTQWDKYDEPFRSKMKDQLLRLQGLQLSVNSTEVVNKSLACASNA